MKLFSFPYFVILITKITDFHYLNMKNFFRIKEYKALFYRLLLVYLFYFIARSLFFIYNYSLLKVTSVGEFFRLAYHGLTFDTTAILYINGLFILFSVLPLWINT